MAGPDRIYEQSAVVPYRFHQGRLEILLVTSSGGERWVIPKGLVEPDLTPAESAAKEALEEAGVTGTVFPEAVGEYAYEKWGGTCVVEVFLLRVEVVLEEWDEMHRGREWVPAEQAAARVREEGLREILRRVPELVGPDGGRA